MPNTAKKTPRGARRRAPVDVSELLDRWSPSAREIRANACECAGCRKRRTLEHTCKVCGYHGPFAVHACSCAEDVPLGLQWWGGELRKAEEASDEQRQAFARERIVDLLAMGRCRCGKDAVCCHGARECPVCGGGGESGHQDNGMRDPWKIIRQLRRELARAKRAQAPRRRR